MRKLKIFTILDGIIMIISVIVMYLITYMGKLDDSIYAGLSSRLGWFAVFWIIFLISASLLSLALSIIIIHKITQNMKKLKIFIILDGIVMVISWVIMHIWGYVGMYNKSIYSGVYVGKSVSTGWELIFWMIFLASSAILTLVLCIIIIHKIVQKVIQKIKKIKN